MELLKSKRFWSAVVGLVAIIITAYVPELRAQIDVIVPGILGIIGILIGGYSVEQAAQSARQ
jgi:hypothetical protein